jgi:exodeoxyribonuclease V beta subunit
MLPVASRERQSSGERAMRVADLASVFGRHADSDFKRSYASRLEQLRFDPLAGYLRGYVDLVFEWNDRFYVVDYKSNHLGPSPAHYEPSQLERPMSENHYVLQYHLYTVALDRYLSLRLPDYDSRGWLAEHRIGSVGSRDQVLAGIGFVESAGCTP